MELTQAQKDGYMRLAEARRWLSKDDGYCIATLYKLATVDAPGTGTLGVTADMLLVVDLATIASWTPRQLGTALVHEFWHVVQGHCTSHVAWACSPQESNVANDMAINGAMLACSRYEFPFDVLKPKDIGAADGLTGYEYLLHSQKKAQKQNQGGQKQGQQQGQGAPQQGQGAPQQGQGTPQQGQGQGKDGQGQGAPQQGQSGQGGLSQYAPATQGTTTGSFAKGRCGSCAGHALPDEPKGNENARSAEEAAGVRQQAAQAVVNFTKQHGQGSLPAGLARAAELALEPPKVRWQTLLQQCVRNSCNTVSGADESRYDRPSRRQAMFGYGHGRPIVPQRVSRLPVVAVAVDTSGSMGDTELGAIMAELQGILRAVRADVRLYVCDAKVHAKLDVARWQDAAKALKGGGGTDFRPVFEAMTKPGEQHADVLIFATDGRGTAPRTAPRGVDVLWLLVGEGARMPCRWGREVRADGK